MNKQHNHNHIYDLCKGHMHAYVIAEMVDGTKIDGIVTGLDEEYVYFALPLEQGEHRGVMEEDPNARQFGYGYGHGYGHGHGHGPSYGYGGYPGYGGPPRRFKRLVLPLAALATLSLLPWY